MKRLLSTLKEKWPEYLLEILVITIGILGAFALNNWNESRNEAAKQVALLSDLKTDFQIRLEEIRGHQAGKIQGVQIIDDLYDQINQQQVTTADESFDSLISNLYISYSFNDEFSSLDMLFATGKINDIANPELRKLLIQWPWLVEEMLEEQRLIAEVLGKTRELVPKYLNNNAIFRSLNFRDYDLGGALSDQVIDTDRLGLLMDRNFVNAISERRAFLMVNIRDGEALIETGSRIIELLETELE